MKLYTVSYGGYGVNVAIFAAESIDDLCKMLNPEQEFEIKRNPLHPERIHYVLTAEGIVHHVEEAEIKPGQIFLIVE